MQPNNFNDSSINLTTSNYFVNWQVLADQVLSCYKDWLIRTRPDSSPLKVAKNFAPLLTSSELLGAGVTAAGMRVPPKCVLWMRSKETRLFRSKLWPAGVSGAKTSGKVVWVKTTGLCLLCWQKSAGMHSASVGPAQTELDPRWKKNISMPECFKQASNRWLKKMNHIKASWHQDMRFEIRSLAECENTRALI